MINNIQVQERTIISMESEVVSEINCVAQRIRLVINSSIKRVREEIIDCRQMCDTGFTFLANYMCECFDVVVTKLCSHFLCSI